MTPAERTRIFRRHYPCDIPGGLSKAKDLHEGKSVAELVREARAGWPKVPVPADPFKAAQKVRERWADVPAKQGGLWEE